MTGQRRLRAVKLAHTVVWAFFAGCIVLIPVAAAQGRLAWGWRLAAVVLVECAVLAVNRGRCPMTDLAARYTSERRANFDIYLPEWLARHNQAIFGTLYAAGLAALAWRTWGP